MRLHDGHSYSIAKRVNGGHWMQYATATDEETAEKAMEYGLRFHLERCPKDAVEFKIIQNY